ncbi:hypothetical protein PV411_38275 [Streptomyces sp. NRRL_B-16638]|jgi:hypothetical protein|uniref:Uncharacterized protein n=2 Tax=Streptomyces coelicolor TaxID=1902 RepID=Q7APJ1_STRCO|nr:hypothetical protein [Streptomyces sp. NRRL_B-16638]AGO88611.1 hypothetical protein [Streptomyces coelicolor]MDX2930340.1 hypothetical protein [Streptomyces sp. NRRL_B-16638]CAC36670.1 hypothetical protein [Streptomyces coelicolor A3(2)]
MADQTDPQHSDEPEGGAEQTPAPAAVPAQSGKKAERTSPRPDVSYTPVSNGMDYLVSVFQHLTEGEKPPGARDLKYTVLHLQAATEVLLKARLAQEHFSLIFQNPAEATYATWESGKFKSCGTLDAFDRLRDIARLDFDVNDRKRIKEPGESRNALQHYGLTYSAYAIESRAARVLDFLITFIHQHLIPGLDPAEAQGVENDMDSFRLQLKGIETLVRQRMNNLRSDLAKVADVTVKCPDCDQWALVAYDGRDEGPSCLFCHQVWPNDPGSAAANYAWIVLGLDEHSTFQDGGDPPVVGCPECGVGALVTEAVTAASQPGVTPLCFSCGTVFQKLIDCEGGCGTVLDIAPDGESIPMCSNCIEIRYARF